MYENRIKHLTELHRLKDKQIEDHEREHPHSDESKVQEWKKERLLLKDEIRRLTKLQWDHDHETVELDDDR